MKRLFLQTIQHRKYAAPTWWKERVHLFEQEKQRFVEKIQSSSKEPIQISVTTTNDEKKILSGTTFQTTPLDLCKQVFNKSTSQSILACHVNNEPWDLTRPLESTTQNNVQFFTFDQIAGKEVYWHSSAHLLGHAMEEEFGEHELLLCDGPALLPSASNQLTGGFFYEAALKNVNISESEFARLEKKMQDYSKQAFAYERIQVSKEFAKLIFAYNRFKLDILQNIPDSDTITLYRCGNLIDLCRGPHLQNSSQVKAIKLNKVSGAYWKGDANQPLLQRVYGITFPDNKLLTAWQTKFEEAAKRDHRNIGKQQNLFMFHEWSPGSPFFFPAGAHVFNKFISFLRSEYRKRGYEEVISPQIFNKELWQVSGHWQHYKQDMFTISCAHHAHHGADGAEETMGVKPMNCPAHCLMFGSKNRSYRELPIRWADFSPLHRNEMQGALSGLTRVRRFHQDDSHIFCTHEQVASEIAGCLDFVKFIYSMFGYKFKLRLSTRPKDFVGTVEIWDAAEESLKKCLSDLGYPWELNEGDGAFYGPKIDIAIEDSLERHHQCATIQLDFQLPQRFNLKYQGEDGKFHTPVIVHRAILGSIERFIALLIEHVGGKWPFWISPRQCIICPVSEKFKDYAFEVAKQIKFAHHGFNVDVDDTDKKLAKKIKDAQTEQYNFILVVGQDEVTKQIVNVRNRQGEIVGAKTVPELVEYFKELEATYQ